MCAIGEREAQDGARASSFDEKMRQHQAVGFGVEMTERRNKCKMIRGVNCVFARVVLKRSWYEGSGRRAAAAAAAAAGGTSWEKDSGGERQNFTKYFSVVMRNTQMSILTSGVFLNKAFKKLFNYILQF